MWVSKAWGSVDKSIAPLDSTQKMPLGESLEPGRYSGGVFDVAVTYLFREVAGRHEVLLGEKLTGIGVGKIVAPGGKSEPHEAPEATAVREMLEEVGVLVDIKDLTHIATIRYPFIGRPELSQRSFAYRARSFTGTLLASSELAATWWPVADIPFDRMWADAALWLPRALDGNFVEATISIGAKDEVVDALFHSGGL